jgi:hypothetical protein
MANLLESLLSSGQVKRQDDKHLTIIRRPAPTKHRQLLELFSAMGVTASFQGLRRSLETKGVDAFQITFVALGRWPTADELAALEDPYKPAHHLMALLRSKEFRTNFVRRTCDAFAERRRLLFVQIPRSAGQTVLADLDSRHPLLPADLMAPRYNDGAKLAETLGHILSRVPSTNTLAIAQPHMKHFLEEPESQAAGPDPLGWRAGSPPCRWEDLLFAVLRDPTERALGQINATLRAYKSGDKPLPPATKERLGIKGDRELRQTELRQVGLDILGETLFSNPMCHALADGTAAGALAATQKSPIHFVAIEHYKAWARTALEIAPSDRPLTEQILRREDLLPAEQDILAGSTQEDRTVYDRVIQRLKVTALPATLGREI